MIDLVTLYPTLGTSLHNLLTLISKSAGVPREEFCERLCECQRAAAIGALLLEMDIDCYYHMLIRSGLTRVFLLERTPPEEKNRSRFCKVTRANGFLDALCANELEVARSVASLSPPQWNRQYEYEDDYCYIRFLHEMVLGGDRGRKEEILLRFKEVLDGERSARLDVCRALLEGDTGGFEEAYAELLNQRTKEVRTQERSISRNDVEFAGGRYIFVEGLAVLRIAEMVGIGTQPEYLYCPKEARMPMQAPFPNDGYPR